MKIIDILNFLDSKGYKYSFIGDSEVKISGFSSLSFYKRGTITWIKTLEAYQKNCGVDIDCAVVQNGVKLPVNSIVSENSKELFFTILQNFWGKGINIGSKGSGTVITGATEIDPSVTIGCNCSIVGNVRIGKGTIIDHNVVIEGKVVIGENCRIQSGVVIGIDGFGYYQNNDSKEKKMVGHFGGVVIGNDVFIGSNTNIARGTIDNTTIGDGVKIAPSTHIAHNNRIGCNTAVICSNLYGSVSIGEGSYITASIIENQKTVGNNTVIGMGSVVNRNIGDDLVAVGIPARPVGINDGKL